MRQEGGGGAIPQCAPYPRKYTNYSLYAGSRLDTRQSIPIKENMLVCVCVCACVRVCVCGLVTLLNPHSSTGNFPLPQSGPYSRTSCSMYTVLSRSMIQCRATRCQHHRTPCMLHTILSVVVCVSYRSQVPGAINSHKPNFPDNSPGSTGLDNASYYVKCSITRLSGVY